MGAEIWTEKINSWNEHPRLSKLNRFCCKILSQKPGDLKWREKTGTSCEIRIISRLEKQYLLKYTLIRFQVYVSAI